MPSFQTKEWDSDEDDPLEAQLQHLATQIKI